MAFQMKTFWVIGGLFTAAVSTSAFAALDTTDPFEGVTVTYSDVVESPDIYGDPVLIAGDILAFDPSTELFEAQAPDTTGGQVIDGALTFTVSANNPNGIVPTLIVSESGDYTLGGLLANTSGVVASLNVLVFDPSDPSTPLITATDVFSTALTTPIAESDSWSNFVQIDLTPFELSSFDVAINNNLQALAADTGATASIRKKAFTIKVPEPTTVAFLISGLGLAALRRRSA